jgi:hypothetical protein
MKTALTKKQAEVVYLMANGWELGLDIGIIGRYWIQKGGLGYGGESRNVHGNTAYFLNRMKMIESVERHFPTERFRLTELGLQTVKTLGGQNES